MTQLDKDTPSEGLASLMIAMSGMLYGGMGYFGTQVLLSGFSLLSMIFWRFFIAMILVGLYARYKRVRLFDLPKGRLKTLLFASLLYGCSTVNYFIASQSIGTGLAMVIFFTYPVFVIGLSRLLDHEKLSFLAGLSLLTILIGMILINLNNGESRFEMTGVFLAILSALFYGGYVYLSKRQIKNNKPIVSTFYVCLGSSGLFFFCALLNQAFQLPQSIPVAQNLLALSVIATAIPAFLLLEGLKAVGASKAAILSVLEPVMTVIIGAVFLNESLSATQFLGVIVVLSGAILIQLKKNPLKKLKYFR